MERFNTRRAFLYTVLSLFAFAIGFMFTGCDFLSGLSNNNNEQGNNQESSTPLTKEIVLSTCDAVWEAIPNSVKNDERWAHFNALGLDETATKLINSFGDNVVNSYVVVNKDIDDPSTGYFQKITFYKNSSGHLVFEMYDMGGWTYYWRIEITGDYNNINTIVIDAHVTIITPDDVGKLSTTVSLANGGAITAHQKRTYEPQTSTEEVSYNREVYNFIGSSNLSEATYYLDGSEYKKISEREQN